MKINTNLLLILAYLFFFLPFESAYSQQRSEVFNYISPMPGSKNILPGNNIALRNGDIIDEAQIKDFKLSVMDSEKGNVAGKLILSDDHQTLIFLPDQPFSIGSRIYVHSENTLETMNGSEIQPVSFWFDIIHAQPEVPSNFFENNEMLMGQAEIAGQQGPTLPAKRSVNDNNLPEDFPELVVNYNNNAPMNEYYFVSPFGYWGWFPDNVPYLIIFDNEGVPVFYQKLPTHPYDFKLHPTGYLSYFLNMWPNPAQMVLDSSYKVIDTYQMGNGYGNCDFHEFHLLPNGHAVVMCYYPEIIDMSQIVPGGQPNATVNNWIIQELDVNKNVVFQWRAWDHYQITDADEHVDLTGSNIDVTHGNSIDVLDDNTWLLSPRNFNEITKIDRNTGDIIWRLGGENNMFEFLNDTLRFSRAHDIRMLGNGNISLFDNGSYHPDPKFSSMIEYDVDETNFTVSLVRRLRSDPDIFGTIMGNAEVTNDQHTIVGWGSGVPGITEFNENNESVFEVYFAGINYRAYRFPWKTNYFKTGNDSLFFGYVWQEDSMAMKLNVHNFQDHDIEITSAHYRTDHFRVLDDFPVTISAGSTQNLWIQFKPDAIGEFHDVITLNSDINNDTLVRRIAQQVLVWGYATEGQNVGEYNNANVKIYPNPVTDRIQIDTETPDKIVQITIYNSTGSIIFFSRDILSNSNTIDLASEAPGVYLVQLTNRQGKPICNSRIIKK